MAFKKGDRFWLGKKRPNMSVFISRRNKESPIRYWLGKHHSEETKKKLSAITRAKLGEESPHWKGGITPFYKQLRDKRVAANGGNHTEEEWEVLKQTFEYMCLCCKRSEPEIVLSKDHIIPISKGGRDGIGNIQPLCRSCNSRKHIAQIDYLSQYFQMEV